MSEKLETAVDARIWQAGFDEAMDRMAYWMDKIGYERDSILRLRGLIETGPMPEVQEEWLR